MPTMIQSQRTLQEYRCTLPPAEVLARAKQFFSQLAVHRQGVGVCGVYTYEVAETKVAQVIDFARRHQHPLQCTLEKE